MKMTPILTKPFLTPQPTFFVIALCHVYSTYSFKMIIPRILLLLVIVIGIFSTAYANKNNEILQTDHNLNNQCKTEFAFFNTLIDRCQCLSTYMAYNTALKGCEPLCPCTTANPEATCSYPKLQQTLVQKGLWPINKPIFSATFTEPELFKALDKADITITLLENIARNDFKCECPKGSTGALCVVPKRQQSAEWEEFSPICDKTCFYGKWDYVESNGVRSCDCTCPGYFTPTIGLNHEGTHLSVAPADNTLTKDPLPVQETFRYSWQASVNKFENRYCMDCWLKQQCLAKHTHKVSYTASRCLFVEDFKPMGPDAIRRQYKGCQCLFGYSGFQCEYSAVYLSFKLSPFDGPNYHLIPYEQYIFTDAVREAIMEYLLPIQPGFKELLITTLHYERTTQYTILQLAFPHNVYDLATVQMVEDDIAILSELAALFVEHQDKLIAHINNTMATDPRYTYTILPIPLNERVAQEEQEQDPHNDHTTTPTMLSTTITPQQQQPLPSEYYAIHTPISREDPHPVPIPPPIDAARAFLQDLHDNELLQYNQSLLITPQTNTTSLPGWVIPIIFVAAFLVLVLAIVAGSCSVYRKYKANEERKRRPRDALQLPPSSSPTQHIAPIESPQQQQQQQSPPPQQPQIVELAEVSIYNPYASRNVSITPDSYYHETSVSSQHHPVCE